MSSSAIEFLTPLRLAFSSASELGQQVVDGSIKTSLRGRRKEVNIANSLARTIVVTYNGATATDPPIVHVGGPKARVTSTSGATGEQKKTRSGLQTARGWWLPRIPSG